LEIAGRWGPWGAVGGKKGGLSETKTAENPRRLSREVGAPEEKGELLQKCTTAKGGRIGGKKTQALIFKAGLEKQEGEERQTVG